MGKICGNFQFCHPFSRWFEIKGFTGMQYLFDLRFLRFSDMARLRFSNLLDASMFVISACIP